MKKLAKLSNAEILHYVMGSKRLREKFYRYISDTEMYWIGEKLDAFRTCRGSADWSIGPYSQNYLCVKDHRAFLYAVEEIIKSFSASDAVLRKVAMCNKLRGTNLFEYHVEKLCELFYEDDLKPVVEFMEKCSYDIHCLNESDDLLHYIECFAETFLGDIYINSNNELVRMDYVC